MIELYIGGQKASGDFTELIGITVNNVNYQDISTRSISFTNQLTLKATPENYNIFFRLTSLLEVGVTEAEMNPSFRILENGQVLLEGYIVPIELTAEGDYKIQLVSKQVDFLTAIQDVELNTIVTAKVKTLQPSITGQSWTSNFIATQLPQLAVGLYTSYELANYTDAISPLYDLGLSCITLDNGYLGVNGGRNIAGLDMRFAMPIKRLFELICDSLGYTLSWPNNGNELAGISFREYAHLLEPTQLSYSDAWKAQMSIGVKGQDIGTYTSLSYNVPALLNYYGRNMAYLTDAVLPTYSSSGIRNTAITVAGNTIRVPNVGFKNKFVAKAWLRIQYTVLSLVTSDQITAISAQIIQSIAGAETGMATVDLSVDLRNQDLYIEFPEFEEATSIERNATYYLRVYVEGNFTTSGAAGTPSIRWETKPIVNNLLQNPNALAGTYGFILENVSQDVAEGFPIEAAQCVPKIKAADLLKYISNYACIYPKIQGNQISLVGLEVGNNNLINWSGKIDFSQGVKNDFRNDNYAKSNIWKYKDETNLTNDKGVIAMQGKTLGKEATLYEAPFAIADTTFALLGITFAQPKILEVKGLNQYFIWNQTNRGINIRYIIGDIVYDEANYYRVLDNGDGGALVGTKPSTAVGTDYELVQWYDAFTSVVTTPIVLYWTSKVFIPEEDQQVSVVTDTAATYGGANTFTDVYGISWANLKGATISASMLEFQPMLAYQPTFSQSLVTAWQSIPKAMQLSRKVYLMVYLKANEVADLLENLNKPIYIKELSKSFYLMQLNQYYIGAEQLTQVILLPI